MLLEVEGGKARIVSEGPPTFPHSPSLERRIWKLLGEDCDEDDDGDGDGDDDGDDDGEEGEAEGLPTYPHSPGLERRKWISRLFGKFWLVY